MEIVPVVAASMAASCATVGVSVMVILPVCSVMFPEKASTRSEEEPERATFVVFNVIVPVVASLIVFNCVVV